jgi:metal-responsive CopG/Arc/MetJ family transcriptional regulator
MTEYVRKTVKINEELWNKFQEKIEEEYGTTYKHTSEEIEKAIENYITEDVYDVEITKTKINNLKDEIKNLE